ncbi:MAG: hypothetical protein P8M16_00275 [Acidimicrobiales bacterium]|nr:hypothetical protein [Acidimicrobiales bacterium]
MIIESLDGPTPKQGRLAFDSPELDIDIATTDKPALGRVVRVVPDVPAVSKAFDYLVPKAWSTDSRSTRLGIGSRVRIVLHGRRVAGWVVEDDVEPVAGVTLRPLYRLSGLGPTPELIDLARWAAQRWVGPLARFLAAASSPTMLTTLASRPATCVVPSVGSRWFDEVWDADLDGRPSIVRLPPGEDVLPLVLGAARLGDALVLAPTVEAARRLIGRLRRAGVPVAAAPRDWAKAAAGGMVVGTRSAVWAPVRDLQAVVVVDEHDDAYREERAPTWSARDVAIERARRAGVPCVLVSATPSVEALEAVGPSRVSLPSRTVERDGWPVVDLIDRRSDDEVRTGLFSPSLVPVLRGDDGDPVVCVLNRKGRSRLMACVACGALARCETHQTALVQDRLTTREADAGGQARLRCPVDDERRPVVCGPCGGTRMRNLRAGVNRVREELEALAGRPVAEVTAETEPSVLDGSHAELFVGTEALLHRIGRRVARVIFLDFDQELLAPRMRAADQGMALLVRAARLLGPRSAGGRIIIQTRQPDHEVLQAALHADPGRLAVAESERRRLLGLPPFGALARVSGAAASKFMAKLEEADGGTTPGVEVMGPRNDAWLVRAPDPDTLSVLLAKAGRPPGRLRIEVDPSRA